MTRSLTFERTVAATPERVFDAWADPSQLARWFGPGTVQTEVIAFELTPGGAYRVIMHGDKDYGLQGVFTAVERPHRLAFTWSFDDMDETTDVELTLAPNGAGGTALKLVHSGFPTESSVQAHNEGWTATFPRLDTLLAPAKAAPHAAAV